VDSGVGYPRHPGLRKRNGRHSPTLFALGPNKTGKGGKAVSPSPVSLFYRLRGGRSRKVSVSGPPRLHAPASALPHQRAPSESARVAASGKMGTRVWGQPWGVGAWRRGAIWGPDAEPREVTPGEPRRLWPASGASGASGAKGDSGRTRLRCVCRVSGWIPVLVTHMGTWGCAGGIS
jgi:hypothetical protein